MLYLGVRVGFTIRSGVGPAGVGAPRSMNHQTQVPSTTVFDQAVKRPRGS